MVGKIYIASMNMRGKWAEPIVDSIKLNVTSICCLEMFWTTIFQEFGIWITTKSNTNFINKLKYIKDRFNLIELNYSIT